MVAAPAVIRACQDKALFLDACAAAGLATPARVNPSGPIPFPVFVKPRIGKGGRDIRRVDGPEELKQALRRVPDAVVQAYVEAPEFTVDLFADLSGRVLSAVPRERVVVFGGESFVSRVVKGPEIAEASKRLAQALGLVGHNTIQCFFDGDQVLFIEVNPRYGGAAHLSFAAGAPSPRWLVRLVQGKPVEVAHADLREGLVMLRYTEDMYLDASQLAKRELV
jgi:carbamoyl-phosphate synthase large subunit